MKISVFNFGDCFTPHLETQADLTQQLLDEGHQVTKFVCNNELPVCYVNPEHKLTLCCHCRSRRAAIRRLITPRVEERSFLKLTKENRKSIQNFRFEGSTIDDLKSLEYEHFDIGMAVASMLIEKYRDCNLEIDRYIQEINDWINASLTVYFSVLNHLAANTADRVYIFNGRRSIYRAVLRACQSVHTDVYCLDGHRNLSRFTHLKNRIRHDLKAHHEDVERLWDEADPTTREQVGRQFFEMQASGKAQFSFTKEQQENLLPQNWNGSKHNVAVFPSSEFELAAISEAFGVSFYKDQLTAIKSIAAELEACNANTHLYVRVHPHLKGDNNHATRALLSLDSIKITVIPAESPISTYALMQSADKVISFASTAGMEAAYRGKPSILLAAAFYQDLGFTYNPKSHDEVMQLLSRKLEPKPIEGTLKYGFHQLNHGAQHVYFQRESTWKGKFKSKYVDDVIPVRWRIALKFTQSRLGPFIDRLSRYHQNWVNYRLGISSRIIPANDHVKKTNIE